MSHMYNHTRRLVGEAPRRGNGYLEPKGADREPAKNFMNGLRSIPAPERKPLTHRVVHYNAVPGTLKMIEDAQNKTNVDLHLDAATAPWYTDREVPYSCDRHRRQAIEEHESNQSHMIEDGILKTVRFVQQRDGGDSDMEVEDRVQERIVSSQTPVWDVIECREHRIPIELQCRGHTVEYDSPEVDGSGMEGRNTGGRFQLSGGFDVWDHQSGREFSDEEAYERALQEEEEHERDGRRAGLTRTPCVVRRLGEDSEDEPRSNDDFLNGRQKSRRAKRKTSRTAAARDRGRGGNYPGDASNLRAANLGRATRGVALMESDKRRRKAIHHLRQALISVVKGAHANLLNSWRHRARDARDKAAYFAELQAAHNGELYPDYLAPRPGALVRLGQDIHEMFAAVQQLANTAEEREERSLPVASDTVDEKHEKLRRTMLTDKARKEKEKKEKKAKKEPIEQCKWCREEKELQELRSSQATQSPKWAGTRAGSQGDEYGVESEESCKFPGLLEKMEELFDEVNQLKRNSKRRRRPETTTTSPWGGRAGSRSPSPLGSPKPVLVRVARDAGPVPYDAIHDTYDINEAIPGVRYPSARQ